MMTQLLYCLPLQLWPPSTKCSSPRCWDHPVDKGGIVTVELRQLVQLLFPRQGLHSSSGHGEWCTMQLLAGVLKITTTIYTQSQAIVSPFVPFSSSATSTTSWLSSSQFSLRVWNSVISKGNVLGKPSKCENGKIWELFPKGGEGSAPKSKKSELQIQNIVDRRGGSQIFKKVWIS